MIPDMRRQRILIVDDEPSNIRILVECLKTDYELNVARGGKEALELAHSTEGLDLILLDIQMPEMTGYEVCRQLKAGSGVKDIPVIFITALSEERDEAKGFDLGAVDYITKPFSTVIVKARVDIHMELKLHRDHLEELAEQRAKQLVHAERLVTLGTLSAGIAHEVSNPLTYISLSAVMMRKMFDDMRPVVERSFEYSEEDREKFRTLLQQGEAYLNSFTEGTERIEAIVKSMKKFARRDTDEKTRCAIDEALNDALRICHSALKYNIEVTQHLDPTLPPIIANSQQLGQVFTNLLNNAAHAMEGRKDGKILIRTEQVDPGHIRITVEDNGHGIPKDKFEAIWEAFMTTKGPEKGTGLGLSISKGIINDHGGSIRAENVETGGARFIIELPVNGKQEDNWLELE
ncbi:MAG: hybrid sensor histidine kinase/response regulator [Spartobacteria bacterium]|nr:hybrid sensor histidine kinase/response regulator [Spartobacteria bacterium]